LLVVCQLRWIYLSTPPININHNCFAQVEFRITPCFKLMRGIEQDLPTCIVLCQSSIASLGCASSRDASNLKKTGRR